MLRLSFFTAPIFIVCMAGLFLTQPSRAQQPASQTSYPTGPIRLVVSSAAGGTGDALARIISKQVAADFGINIIIDNRPGASGIIAADTDSTGAVNNFEFRSRQAGRTAELALPVQAGQHIMEGPVVDGSG